MPGAYIEFAERKVLPEFADMPVRYCKYCTPLNNACTISIAVLLLCCFADMSICMCIGMCMMLPHANTTEIFLLLRCAAHPF